MPSSIGLKCILHSAKTDRTKECQYLINVRGEIQPDTRTAVVKSKLSEKLTPLNW